MSTTTTTTTGTAAVAATTTTTVPVVPSPTAATSTTSSSSSALYNLIVSQLKADGHNDIAEMLAGKVHINSNDAVSSTKLSSIVAESSSTEPPLCKQPRLDTTKQETDVLHNLEVKYVARYDKSCRVAKFSNDGTLLAAGDSGSTIKLFDVERMKLKPHQQQRRAEEAGLIYRKRSPRITIFYVSQVNDLAFNPSGNVLVGAMNDKTCELFSVHAGNPRNNKSIKKIQNDEVVRSVAFHPSGKFILMGTETSLVKLYDITSEKSFCPRGLENSTATERHSDMINHVAYSPDGKTFLSCSRDGSIKMWDGTSGRCVMTIPGAHRGLEVSSVQYSKDSKRMLSSGKDGTVRLWDLSMPNQVQIYARKDQQPTKFRVYSCFSCKEDCIISTNEVDHNAVLWNTLTGKMERSLNFHSDVLRCVAASPTEMGFATCGADAKVCFWYDKLYGN